MKRVFNLLIRFANAQFWSSAQFQQTIYLISISITIVTFNNCGKGFQTLQLSTPSSTSLNSPVTTPNPSPTFTPTPIPSPSPSSPIPTVTPVPPSPVPTATPISTPTPSPMPSPTTPPASPTPTPVPPTPTPTPIPSPSPSPSSTPNPSPIPSWSITPIDVPVRDVVKSQSVRFRVNITAAAQVTYQWYQGNSIYPQTLISGATNSEFILPNVDISNSGDYTVAATSAGVTQTYTFTINVKDIGYIVCQDGYCGGLMNIEPLSTGKYRFHFWACKVGSPNPVTFVYVGMPYYKGAPWLPNGFLEAILSGNTVYNLPIVSELCGLNYNEANQFYQPILTFNTYTFDSQYGYYHGGTQEVKFHFQIGNNTNLIDLRWGSKGHAEIIYPY